MMKIHFKFISADLSKKKIITSILFAIIAFASCFIVSGTHLMTVLHSALNNFFVQSQAPHVIQMTERAIDKNTLDQFVKNISFIKKHQVVEMLNISGADVYLGQDQTSEKNNVMNIDFVTQNTSFDFLISLQGSIPKPARGEIAVPIYFMQTNHLNIGDRVSIHHDQFQMQFTIVDFIRDSQMNPSIVHSKRFLIHPADFELLKKSTLAKKVNLIEFQFYDVQKTKQFYQAYQQSTLPQDGPMIDERLLRILNAVTDGFIIGMIVFISLLMITIALLCLKFTLNLTIEEEFQQIGIMKALGIRSHDIKIFYLGKYVVITLLACCLGYIGALYGEGWLMRHINLYFGTTVSDQSDIIYSLLATAIVFLIIVCFCWWILRKSQKISPVAVLKGQTMISANNRAIGQILPLNKNIFLNLNVFLGCKNVIQRFDLFALLFIIFLICTFVIIVPINILNTIQSKHFVAYMGIGESDIRIDGNDSTSLEPILSSLARDQDIQKYNVLTTARFQLINAHQTENINIEMGDFTVFPLAYLEGHAPQNDHEVALSYLSSQQLKKRSGQALQLLVNNRPQNLRVSGIYQDITNGGRTAKAHLPFTPDTIQWYVITANLKPITQAKIKNKITVYKKQFYPYRVTFLTDYIQQTLGDIIQYITAIVLFSTVMGTLITILITSLFLKLLIIKHYAQIAVMKAIGFSFHHIRIQYITMTLVVLTLGITCGAVLANTAGQKITGLIWAFMGAPDITFIIHPLEVYIYCPLLLISIVSMVTYLSTRNLKKIRIMNMITE